MTEAGSVEDCFCLQVTLPMIKWGQGRSWRQDLGSRNRSKVHGGVPLTGWFPWLLSYLSNIAQAHMPRNGTTRYGPGLPMWISNSGKCNWQLKLTMTIALGLIKNCLSNLRFSTVSTNGHHTVPSILFSFQNNTPFKNNGCWLTLHKISFWVISLNILP